jgi:hypothetical protein
MEFEIVVMKIQLIVMNMSTIVVKLLLKFWSINFLLIGLCLLIREMAPVFWNGATFRKNKNHEKERSF